MKDLPPRSEPFQEESSRAFSTAVIRAASTGTVGGTQSFAVCENVGSLQVGVLHEATGPVFEVFVSPQVPNEGEDYPLHTIRLSYGFLDPDTHKVKLISGESMFSAAEEVEMSYDLSQARERMAQASDQPKRFLDMDEAWVHIAEEQREEGIERELDDILNPEDAELERMVRIAFLGDRVDSGKKIKEVLEELQFHQIGIRSGLFNVDPEKVVKVATAINMIFFPEKQDDVKQAEQILSDVLII
ncbi:MAG TPA: hypothetical protein VNA13_03165 [Xanthomonadales bacterium]|nr:hypothetical protein [Xanthomonadales bacterium]